MGELVETTQRIAKSEKLETKSIEIKDALSRSEAKYRTLVEHLPAITYIAAIDKASTTLYISPQVKKFIGFTSKEYMHDPDLWRKQLHQDDRERVLKEVNCCHAENKPLRLEYRMVTRNGNIVHFRDEAVIVKDKNRKPIFLQGVMYNITESKKAEDDLIKEQKKYQDLYDNTPAMFVSVDHESRNVIECNKILIEKTGYCREEIIGRHIFERYHESSLDNAKKAFQSFLDVGIIKNVELVLKKKDGGIINVILNVTSVKDKDGNILSSRSVWQDITERKKMEEALEQSKQRYHDLFDQANEGLFVMTLDGKLSEVNRAFAEMHGYTVDELKNMDIRELDVLKEKTMEARADIVSRMQAGETIRFDVEHYHKDGHIFPLSITASMVNISGRQFYLAFHQDITERKNAEGLLRDSEEKHRRLFENVSDAVMTFDAETKQFEDANPATLKLFGYEKDEFLRLTVFDISAEKKKTKTAVEKVINRKKGSEKVPLRYLKKKNGDIFSAEISTGEFIQAGHKKIIGAVRDITERKQAEEQLNEQKLSLEQKNAALREILEQVHIEKDKIKDDIAVNIRESVMPVLEKLKRKKDSRKYAELLQSHLENIASSFGREITKKSYNLTPRELEICNMVKGRLTSKEISKMLHLSQLTIEKHRRNIRKKLRISGKKSNLTTFLKTS